MKRIYLVMMVIGLFFATGTRALAQSGGPFNLDWHTIDGGGGTSSGGNFSLSGTVGQHDAGGMTGGDFRVNGGFWQCFQPAAVTDVSISDAGGGTVDVAWSGGALGDVWQSADPYFSAGDAGSTLEGDGVSSPFPVPGMIGDPANNHYFLVLAQNDCGVSGPSNRTGEFDFTLVPGN